MLASKGDFYKIELSLQQGLDFSRCGGLSWKRKSTKNQFKKEVQDTTHPGIGFSPMLVDFGNQVGAKLGWKIDPKSHQKSNKKTIPTRKAPGGVSETYWRTKKPPEEGYHPKEGAPTPRHREGGAGVPERRPQKATTWTRPGDSVYI